VRDRDVLLLMALVVAVVLIANVASAVIPGMDRVMAGLPILVIVLVVGTGVVLFWSVGRRR
jgi:FtsH-binding integral membrane protein